MANMAVSRIKREFKEVIKSEEVSQRIFCRFVIFIAISFPAIKLTLRKSMCSPTLLSSLIMRFIYMQRIWYRFEWKQSDGDDLKWYFNDIFIHKFPIICGVIIYFHIFLLITSRMTDIFMKCKSTIAYTHDNQFSV